MRHAFAALGLSLAFALATPAIAAPVTVRAAAIDNALQEKFAEDYGEREIAVLQRAIASAISHELADVGATVQDGGAIAVEVTLLDVKPSRPTMQQLIDKPGLDSFRSVGLGGASLQARIVGADGATLGEVSHRWFETDLEFAGANTTWSDANRAIRRFARKVAQSYRASAPS